MIRRIIKIDRERCNGCGLCAQACHEGAIGMVEGKAQLLRDDYCDGLGDCLPVCPTGAITFVEREAAPYDAAAVAQSQKSASRKEGPHSCPGSACSSIPGRSHAPASPAVSQGCPGSRVQTLKASAAGVPAPAGGPVSHLAQWPVQIKLLPVEAPFYQGARLLVAADCTAFSRGDFHQRFMQGRITMIGCPKLDSVDYAEKLSEIFRCNDIQDVTVVRMEVPCCGGIQRAVEAALAASGKKIPWQVVTLGRDGSILGEVHHETEE